MPDVVAAAAVTSVWDSPIVLGGMITIALAIISGLQLFVVNKMTTGAQAASELRAALIRKTEKEEDYKRQDEVAAKAAEAARLLLEAQHRQTVRQDAVADQVALAAKQAANAAGLLVETQKATNARQDAVADLVAKAAQQAANAAMKLEAAQALTIARTDEVARLEAEKDLRIQAQLIALDEQGKKIHILVNSDMTAARKAERDTLRLLLVALKNSQSMAEKLGMKPGTHDQEEIERVEQRVIELNQILADRLSAQEKIDAEDTAAGRDPQRRAADAHRTTEET